MSAVRRIGALLLLGVLAGCGPRRVNACDERRVGDQTCVDVQLEGGLADIERLAITVMGDWVGYSEISMSQALALPAAVAVVMPPSFTGTVRVQVAAQRGAAELARAAEVVRDLQPAERRSVTLTLEPAAADGGAGD